MNILGICGSLRKDSWNRKLLALAATRAQYLGESLELFDLIDVPLYNQDVEDRGMPEAVARMRTRLEWADIVLIVSPEYNYSIPGVMKNAIDWASRAPNRWDGKVVGIMGATMGNFGTVSMQGQMRQVLSGLNATVVGYPAVLLPQAQKAFDAQGNLTNESAAKNVDALLKRLVDVAKKLHA